MGTFLKYLVVIIFIMFINTLINTLFGKEFDYNHMVAFVALYMVIELKEKSK